MTEGAISAAVGKAATGFLTDAGSWGDNNLNNFTRGVAVSMAGGLASKLAGGKFDNGATTAAFGYLFNYLSDKTGVLDKLAGKSQFSASGIARLKASETTYTVVFDENFRGDDGGPAGTRPNNDGSVTVIVNPKTAGDWEYRSAKGHWTTVTVEQVIAHEVLGHALIIDQTSRAYARHPANMDKAIANENRVMNEYDPSRPARIENHFCPGCYRRKQ